MKVNVITRTAESCSRERKGDLFKIKRNADADLHPFQRAREYVRSISAAKLDRMFAKPFVAALPGHVDGVYCMNRHPSDLKMLASASADGELRLWNVANRKCTWTKKDAHSAFVRGVAFLPRTETLLSCGDDKVVKLWDYSASASSSNNNVDNSPIALFQGKGTFTGVDAHRDGQTFATSGSQEVAVWDRSRRDPTSTFSWGADTVNCVRFNQSEASLLASCSSDRSLMLHDLRLNQTISKVVLKMRSNAVCWNPQEAVYLSVANEDYNVYTFDMRYFDRAVNVMQGHVSAILDLDYSPTGQELVTAGYDKSLRIFNIRQGHSRDIYHTNRMQRLFCVRYSMDSKYVFSGSDDGNIRIWKAQASEQLGIKNHRQQEALDYQANVLERHKALPQVNKIVKHRSIPKAIKTQQRQHHEHRMAENKKSDNRKKHSKPGTVPSVGLREGAVLQVKK